MATIRRMNFNNWIQDSNNKTSKIQKQQSKVPKEFDSNPSPELELDRSGSALLKAKLNNLKKSAQSKYSSNSRAGVYAMEEQEIHSEQFQPPKARVSI